MKNSKIAWTDHTFNPWMGCSKVSDGCKFCYAEELMYHRYNKVEWGVNGKRVRTNKAYWNNPIKWNKEKWEECSLCGWRGPASDTHTDCPICDNEVMTPTRQRVFCASLADVFEDNPQVEEWRIELFDLIHKTPNIDWLLLTKRPENICSLWPAMESTLPNIWLGTTVESQKHISRIIDLLEVPAAVNFISIEPMLSPINLGFPDYANPKQDTWVIVGGESGKQCRPMNLDWARSIRDQCQAAHVPFFMKQLGGYPNKFDDLQTFPEDLQIREFPKP